MRPNEEGATFQNTASSLKYICTYLKAIGNLQTVNIKYLVHHHHRFEEATLFPIQKRVNPYFTDKTLK